MSVAGPLRRAAAALLIVILALAIAVPPAEACIECVALGLASFAVFTQLVWALSGPRVVYAVPGGWPYPAVYAPAYSSAAYAAYPMTSAAPAPQAVAWTGPRVVQYAHGRYELRGDGVSVPYAWVWIPTAASPPPSPVGTNGGAPQGSWAKTP
jgi:hypothetical protein